MYALFFISLTDAWEALLYFFDFSGRYGWKNLDIDVRPSFHLESGYPQSKHKTQLTNESNRQAQRSKAVFKGVMMYEGPAHSTATTTLYLYFYSSSWLAVWASILLRGGQVRGCMAV